jgi:hypothetical protein
MQLCSKPAQSALLALPLLRQAAVPILRRALSILRLPATHMWLALAAASTLSGGCFLSTDLSDTEFLCAEEPICPDGYQCVDGRCVSGGGATDGTDGTDGSGDDGATDGDDGSGPDAGGPPPEFAFRQQLTISNLERGELVDFPLMIALDAERIDYAALRPDGADLELRDASGAPLAHEIERWDPEGRSIVWVRVPRIEAGSDTGSIFLYYGDPDAQVVGDEESVWTAYEEVYHLDGDGGEIDDAAARDYDGSAIGSETVDGFVGLGQRFDGFGQHIDLGGERDFARAAPGLTLEAWVHPQIAQQSVVFGAAVGGADNSRVELRYEVGQFLRAGARTDEAGDLQAAVTQELLPLDTWSWVAVVCDFEAGEVSIYIDDHLSTVARGLLFDATTPDTPSSRATIGADESLASDFFGGLLDEVRLAPQALPADWIAAQNASMRDQMVEFGPAEAL